MLRTRKWFALTGDITDDRVVSASLAIELNGYTNVRKGHNRLRFTNGKVRWSRSKWNPLQPVWHASNRVCLVFHVDSTETLTAVKTKLVDSFLLIENIIENEERAYDPSDDSDVAHNLFCQYDYKAAAARWMPLKCHRCGTPKDASAFLWMKTVVNEHLTDLERVLAMYEFGKAPCCDTCMWQATINDPACCIR